MGKTTIEWCDYTFNPWIGCTKVSPACDNCYAQRWGKRFGVEWGPKDERRHTSASTWRQPLLWNAQAQRQGIRYRVFCASLADVFENNINTFWRSRLFTLIENTPHLDWLLLTKRVGNVKDMLPVSWFSNPFQHGPDPANIYPAGPLENVWIGITVCNQEEADRDIPKLLSIPAAKRFVSIEPMLGPVDLERTGAIGCDCTYITYDGIERCTGNCRFYKNSIDKKRIDWVICGGETGPGARPMHPEWVRSLRDQCQGAGVPFFFKQWGEWTDFEHTSTRWWNNLTEVKLKKLVQCFIKDKAMNRIGKRVAGRLLDGREWNEVPV